MAEAIASGDTPAVNQAGTPPVDAQTPPQSNQEETVTLSKLDMDKLQKQAAQAAEAQSRADKLEVENRKLTRPGARKVEAPTPFEANELSVIKSKITATLLTNPDYRELIGKKPELARILAKDPTGLLEANEFVDAEDAISQVLDYLDEQVVASKSGVPPVTPAPVETPPAAPATANPSGTASKTPEQMTQEQFDKLPPMERIQAKIAGKISVK